MKTIPNFAIYLRLRGAGEAKLKNKDIQVSNSNTSSLSHAKCNREKKHVFQGRKESILIMVSLGLALILSSSFLIAPVQADTYVFSTAWGGTVSGTFYEPYGVAVDSLGYVYVTDRVDDRVQKFTSSGDFVTTWGSLGSGDGQFDTPWGVAVDDLGYVYVADGGNSRVQKFTSSGVFVGKWGNSGSDYGQFYVPTGVAVDSLGYVYVADFGNSRVQKFTSSGDFVTTFGGWGLDVGQLKYPTGVAVDDLGYVYVVDEGNDRVQKFTSSGVFVTAFGGWGLESENGKFEDPYCVAVDSLGFVYVTDGYHERVQKFRVEYDASFGAWSTPGWAVLPINVDGFSTGFDTPNSFVGLTGIHNFTVPEYYDYGTDRYFFTYWMKDDSIVSTTRTLTVGSGGTYHAHYTSVLKEFDVTTGENDYTIGVCSNLNVTELSFDDDLKRLRLGLEGSPGTRGACNVSIPEELMSGDFSLFVDGLQETYLTDLYTILKSSNGTHYSLSLNYLLNSHVIDIYSTVAVPDFTAWLFLPFLLSATLFGLALRKRMKKHPNLNISFLHHGRSLQQRLRVFQKEKQAALVGYSKPSLFSHNATYLDSTFCFNSPCSFRSCLENLVFSRNMCGTSCHYS